jgi:hypothetical protein
MKNENGNYMLYCGDKSYEVTPEVQETLKGAMYWEHCLKLDNIELKNAELAVRAIEDGTNTSGFTRYTKEDVNELRNAVKQDDLSIKDMMNEMEKQGVPNWAGNAALEFGRKNDLRVVYFSDFFEKSPYADATKFNAYEEYKKEWIADHIDDVTMTATEAAYENCEEAKEMTFDQYVQEYGFEDGSVYASYSEFLHNEYEEAQKTSEDIERD